MTRSIIPLIQIARVEAIVINAYAQALEYNSNLRLPATSLPKRKLQKRAFVIVDEMNAFFGMLHVTILAFSKSRHEIGGLTFHLLKHLLYLNRSSRSR